MLMSAVGLPERQSHWYTSRTCEQNRCSPGLRSSSPVQQSRTGRPRTDCTAVAKQRSRPCLQADVSQRLTAWKIRLIGAAQAEVLRYVLLSYPSDTIPVFRDS